MPLPVPGGGMLVCAQPHSRDTRMPFNLLTVGDPNGSA